MKVLMSIEGYVHVGKVVKNEYGTSATLSEIGEQYPQTFSVELPDGQTLPPDTDVKLTATCNAVTVGKADKRFTKYRLLDFTVKRVTLNITEEPDEPKARKGA